MFLIDTNILSEFRRPERVNPGVMAWTKGTTPTDLFISAITLFEIEQGNVQQRAHAFSDAFRVRGPGAAA